MSAILSEKKYETKFITTARPNAMIMPRWPPRALPTNRKNNVMPVSNRAVLKVFPIPCRCYRRDEGRGRGCGDSGYCSLAILLRVIEFDLFRLGGATAQFIS